MKKTIVLMTALLIAPATFGAPMGMTEIKELKNQHLELVRQLAQISVSNELFGNCGNVQAVRLESLDGVNLSEAIEAVVTNEYVETVSVSSVSGEDMESKITNAVSAFTRESDYFDDEALDERAETQAALKSLLILATGNEGEKRVQFFQGSLDGAFSLEIGFMAIVDTKNKEILVVGEGYCE